MARIQVPKKGTFTCNSSTAEEAVEYLRQVSPGRLRSVDFANMGRQRFLEIHVWNLWPKKYQFFWLNH